MTALNGFFNAPTSADMRVALHFFSDNEACNGSSLATPAVPLNLLSSPGHITALSTALNGNGPGGNTRTEAAIRGLTQFTAANNPAPARVIIGILITDGVPTECNTNDGTLSGIMSSHLSATGIQTYVIGMSGANFGRLETLAVAGGAMTHSNYCNGGASSCHYYDVGNGNSQAFIDALQAIQTSALGCTYNVPTTSMGIVNPDSIEIVLTPGGPLNRVLTPGLCTGAGGWYYDNNVNPTSITLCQATCDTVANDPSARIDIILLCEGS